MFNGRGSTSVWEEVSASRQAAHAKHGDNSIESLTWNNTDWPIILMEEVGEVAHALTYDASKPWSSLRAELIDVLAVASAWIDALDREGQRGN